MQEIPRQDPEDFKSLFLQQQANAVQCDDNRGRRWHPLIIRWCFQLHATSPKAYQMLKDSGLLILPDKRTLRDYSNCFKGGIGFDSAFLDLVKKDFLDRSNPLKESDAWVGIIHDEVSLRQDLVFDDSGKLVGFVDLGSTQNSIDFLENSLSSDNSSNSPDEATFLWLLVFSLIGKCLLLSSPPPQLSLLHYLIFFGSVFKSWKRERGIKVLSTTCDGASPHRTFYKYHCPPGDPKGAPIYKTLNPYAEENRYIFFICDPVHLLKTARNNWENSFWRSKTRKLRNNGM